MFVTLLVYKDYLPFAEFITSLQQQFDFEVISTDSRKEALQTISNTKIDIVIVDEMLQDINGIEFIDQLVRVNPLTHYAAVSSLPPEKFHEESEGLGVLMQLPPKPQAGDAENLVNKIQKISQIMGNEIQRGVIE